MQRPTREHKTWRACARLRRFFVIATMSVRDGTSRIGTWKGKSNIHHLYHHVNYSIACLKWSVSLRCSRSRSRSSSKWSICTMDRSANSHLMQRCAIAAWCLWLLLADTHHLSRLSWHLASAPLLSQLHRLPVAQWWQSDGHKWLFPQDGCKFAARIYGRQVLRLQLSMGLLN